MTIVQQSKLNQKIPTEENINSTNDSLQRSFSLPLLPNLLDTPEKKNSKQNGAPPHRPLFFHHHHQPSFHSSYFTAPNITTPLSQNLKRNHSSDYFIRDPLKFSVKLSSVSSLPSLRSSTELLPLSRQLSVSQLNLQPLNAPVLVNEGQSSQQEKSLFAIPEMKMPEQEDLEMDKNTKSKKKKSKRKREEELAAETLRLLKSV